MLSSPACDVDRVLLVVERDETLMEFPVGIPITGVEDAVGPRPQDGAQVGILVIAQALPRTGRPPLSRRMRSFAKARPCDLRPREPRLQFHLLTQPLMASTFPLEVVAGDAFPGAGGPPTSGDVRRW